MAEPEDTEQENKTALPYENSYRCNTLKFVDQTHLVQLTFDLMPKKMPPGNIFCLPCSIKQMSQVQEITLLTSTTNYTVSGLAKNEKGILSLLLQDFLVGTVHFGSDDGRY